MIKCNHHNSPLITLVLKSYTTPCVEMGPKCSHSDEMSTMYGQLDLYKQSGSVMDRKTLITLNGGSSWSRNYRNYSASMSQTAFNMAGFIQPTFVEKMLLSEDADGFNDRQMFVFPPQRDVLFNDLKLPIPSNVPPLTSVYSHVREMHKISQEYTFDDDALIDITAILCYVKVGKQMKTCKEAEKGKFSA